MNIPMPRQKANEASLENYIVGALSKVTTPKLSPAQWLLAALAVGQGAALVYAGVILDGHTEDVYFVLSIFRALPGGIAASFAAAYSTHNITRHGGKQSKIVGWVAIGLLIACSVIVTTICTVEPPTGAARWIASGAYALMIDAAVVAVAVTSGKLFVEPESAAKVSTPKESVKKVSEPAETYQKDIRKLTQAQKDTLSKLTPEEISAKVGVSLKSGQNWKKAFEKESGKGAA